MSFPQLERAVTLFESNQFALALQEFEQLAAASADPSRKAGFLVDQANCLSEMDRVAEAKLCLAEAAQLSRNEPMEAITIALSQVCLQLLEDDRSEALAHLSQLLEEYAECLQRGNFLFLYRDIQMQRGFLLMELNRYPEALSTLQEVRSLQAEGEIYCHLGRCYHGLGNHRSAQQHLLLAAEVGVPEDWQAAFPYYLGCSYYELGQFALAKQQFLDCIQAESSVEAPANVYQKLAAACSKLGGHEDAARYTQLAGAATSNQHLAQVASVPY